MDFKKEHYLLEGKVYGFGCAACTGRSRLPGSGGMGFGGAVLSPRPAHHGAHHVHRHGVGVAFAWLCVDIKESIVRER